jgi:hypothetical protein
MGEFLGGKEVTMRIRTLPVMVALSALVLLGTQALAGSNGSFQVAVPFDFIIGDKVLPPAAYIVEIAGGTEPNVLRIRTMESGDRVMFDTNQMPEKADPKTLELVFDTVGDKTYLTEVWGVTDSGREVKQMVGGHLFERPSEASRRHVTAIRVLDTRDKDSGK